ncbi:hypothetical protein DFH09DRAFT_1365453 [Mycena vulgaris]|nr:hypothetical protein DFH09DRAFT_1365453 [Mycena vulgaris]
MDRVLALRSAFVGVSSRHMHEEALRVSFPFRIIPSIPCTLSTRVIALLRWFLKAHSILPCSPSSPSSVSLRLAVLTSSSRSSCLFVPPRATEYSPLGAITPIVIVRALNELRWTWSYPQGAQTRSRVRSSPFLLYQSPLRASLHPPSVLLPSSSSLVLPSHSLHPFPDADPFCLQISLAFRSLRARDRARYPTVVPDPAQRLCVMRVKGRDLRRSYPNCARRGLLRRGRAGSARLRALEAATRALRRWIACRSCSPRLSARPVWISSAVANLPRSLRAPDDIVVVVRDCGQGAGRGRRIWGEGECGACGRVEWR